MFLQRVVQNVGSRMSAADRLPTAVVDNGLCLGVSTDGSGFQKPMVQDDVAVFLRIGDLKNESWSFNRAGVADLSATFAIERCLVERHDR